SPSHSPTFTLYGDEFTRVLGPSQPVTGRVVDRVSGEGIAGVEVTGYQLAGKQIFGGQSGRRSHAVTDAEGHFRLTGLPVGKNSLQALPSAETCYLLGSVKAETSLAKPQPQIELKLFKGALVRGLSLNSVTGEPVCGSLEYFAFEDNPHLKSAGGLRGADVPQNFYRTNDAGEFEIPVLPGGGLLAFTADSPSEFVNAIGTEEIPEQHIERDPTGLIFAKTLPYRCDASLATCVQVLDIPPAGESIEVKLRPQPGRKLTGQVVTATGEVLTGSRVYGAYFAAWQTTRKPSFDILQYLPHEGRRLVAYHAERDLVGELVVTGPVEAQPVKIVVHPAGRVTGRLVDEDGEPIPTAELRAMHFQLNTPAMASSKDWLDLGVLYQNPSTATVTTTDAEGRFALRGIQPGLKYSIQADYNDGRRDQYGIVFEDVVLPQAESKDLGDVTLKPLPQPMAMETNLATEAAKPLGPTSKQTTRVLRGTVRIAAGQALPEARVAMVARSLAQTDGGDLSGDGEVLASGVTDAHGQYSLTLQGVSSRTHGETDVIAMKDGFGLTWAEFAPDAVEAEHDLVLAPEQPIQLRLIDSEGQPAAGVRFEVTTLTAPDFSQGNRDGVGFWGAGFRSDAPADCWPAAFTSDMDGRCVIKGVAPGVGVFVKTRGDERFAAQFVRIVSRPAGDEPRDPTTHALVVTPGEEQTVVLAPAQIFEGVVRYADTGKPAPHARLTVFSRNSHFSGTGLGGVADEQGRYRINAYPGQSFHITAYPPRGQSYLVSTIEDVELKAADRVKTLDVSLTPGVLTTGQLVETQTGQPIAEAMVQYHPKDRNRFNRDDYMTGWQGARQTDEEGRFEIVIPPGPGTLVFHGPRGEFVHQAITDLQLSNDELGGIRQYYDAIREVDLQPGETLPAMQVELQRGQTVAGRLVDETGHPIEKGLMICRSNIYHFHMRWCGISEDVLNGQFERRDVPSDQPLTVHFLDAERKLGATASIHANQTDPTIVLHPCGAARLRMVNSQDQPVEGAHISVGMVLAPGCSPNAMKQQAAGKLAADEDLINNIDRTNHWDQPPSGKDGVIELPALIPGATYRMYRPVEGFNDYVDFTVDSGEVRDLGDVVVPSGD
ncbi:MAG: carboxypeptidase-like regulatory domain-containing protein, partial [Planctomycetaceae bacterium]